MTNMYVLTCFLLSDMIASVVYVIVFTAFDFHIQMITDIYYERGEYRLWKN